MKRVVLLVFGCMFVAGCGGVADVKGTVTYKGQLLKFGSVTAVPSNGLTVQTNINEDGTYALKGLSVGEAKFGVYCQDPKFVDAVKELAEKGKDVGGEKGGVGGRVAPRALNTGGAAKAIRNPNLVPDKYIDPDKGLLKYTVLRGQNTYNITLEP